MKKCKTPDCILRAFNSGVCGRCKAKKPVLTSTGTREYATGSKLKQLNRMILEIHRLEIKEWTSDETRMYMLKNYDEVQGNRHKLRKQLIADGYYTMQ